MKTRLQHQVVTLTEQAPDRQKVRLLPISRLTQSFDRELNLDKRRVFNREFYERYLERQQEAEAKLHQVLRAAIKINTVLFLVINGQDWTIPFAEVSISSVPAIVEILLFYSSLSFIFLCGAFATNQCYGSIIDHCGNRIVDSSLVDPDFYNAAWRHYDFVLKLYRPTLNFWGIDFFKPGKGFTVFSKAVTWIFAGAVFTIPIIHLGLIFSGSAHVIQSDLAMYAKIMLIGGVALLNAGGIAIVFGMMKDFTFYEISPPPSELELQDGNVDDQEQIQGGIHQRPE